MTSFSDFSADRGRSFFLAVIPRTLWSKYVVVSCNPTFDAVVAMVRLVQSFAEKLLPSIFAVGSGRKRTLLGAFGIGGVELVIKRIDTSRRTIENPPNFAISSNAIKNV